MINNSEKIPLLNRPAFVVFLLVAISLLLNWPYLKGGYSIDDIVIYNSLQQTPLPFSHWKGVWAGFDMSSFSSIWWIDPETSIAFWRPIPSLVIEAFMRIFDRNAFPLHLLSILLHGGIAAGIYIFVRKITKKNLLALIAGLLFVACEDHSMTIGWIATITDLFSGFLIMIAMIAHVEWLQKRKPGALITSIVALILALGSKESAVLAPIGILLINLFMPNGVDCDSFEWPKTGKAIKRVFRDIPSWLPQVLAFAAYILIYRVFFTEKLVSLLYISPLSDFGGYLSALLIRLPVLWLGTFSPALINFIMFMPDLLTPMAIAGAVIFIAWLIALWPFRNRPLTLWSFVLYIIALLPQVCTDPSSRGLYFPFIPASIIIALVASSIGPLRRVTLLVDQIKSRWTIFIGWMSIFGILIPGIFLSIAMPYYLLPGLEKPEHDFRTAIPYIEEGNYDNVVFLNASGFMLALYAWDYMEYLMDDPPDVSLLSAADGIFALERTGENSFIIRDDRPGWLGNFVARALRADPEFSVGKRYSQGIVDATVIETTEDSLDVLAVEFRFEIPLDDPGILFLRWNGETFEPLDIASLEIGEEVELADTSVVFGPISLRPP